MARKLLSKPPFAIQATLIHSTSPSRSERLSNALLAVDEDGKISHLIPEIPTVNDADITLYALDIHHTHPLTVLPWPHHFLIPGLVDTHIHGE